MHKSFKLLLVFLFSAVTVITYAQEVQTLYYSHGKYSGQVAAGKANGFGTYTSAKSNVTYTGNFINDTFNGQGTMFWPDGSKFVGTWQNDSAVQGSMIYPDGRSVSGTVKNAVFYPSSGGNGGVTGITSAQDYVMNRRWSLGALPCETNGGAYQVYSRNFPAGYAFYAGGKPNLGQTRQDYSFKEVSSSEFVHTARFYANEMVARQLGNPNIISGEVITNVRLVSPNRIEYSKRIKQLNFDALMNGQMAYETKNESGYGLLCN